MGFFGSTGLSPNRTGLISQFRPHPAPSIGRTYTYSFDAMRRATGLRDHKNSTIRGQLQNETTVGALRPWRGRVLG